MTTNELLALVGSALLLTGCVYPPPKDASSAPVANRLDTVTGTTVDRVVDAKYGVVCYVSDGYNSGGISCIAIDAARSRNEHEG